MERLIALQRAIENRADGARDASFMERLGVTRTGDQYHLDFYGDPSGESFGDLLAAVSDSKVASSIVSLDLRGPDEGANGTRNWDLQPIAESTVAYPVLRRLAIEQSKPTDHNRTIVGSEYNEEGVLAKILARAPKLEVLISPSAPNADFFQIGERPLEFLSVDAGYDHESFIANLARSSCFANLRTLEWGEYNETYMDDFSSHLTPFADYRALFTSPAFAAVRVFQWRNPACSPAEMEEIKALKKGRQVLVARWSAEWLR